MEKALLGSTDVTAVTLFARVTTGYCPARTPLAVRKSSKDSWGYQWQDIGRTGCEVKEESNAIRRQRWESEIAISGAKAAISGKGPTWKDQGP